MSIPNKTENTAQCNCRLWVEHRLGQTIEYKIDMCSSKHVTLRSKSKDRLARRHDNVPRWSGMA